MRHPVLLALVPACGGGGQYGYAHEYSNIDGEDAYARRVVDTSYEEVRHARTEDQTFIGWFGVVAEPPAMHEAASGRPHRAQRRSKRFSRA